jgi:hypothetical protein
MATDGGEMAAQERTGQGVCVCVCECVRESESERARDVSAEIGRHGCSRWALCPFCFARAQGRAARTDCQCASEREVAAASELLVLLLSQDGAKGPVPRDEADVQSRKVHAGADNRDRPAEAAAFLPRESMPQKEKVGQGHEHPCDMEALASDLFYRACHLAQRYAARTQQVCAAPWRLLAEEDYGNHRADGQRKDVLEQELLGRVLMLWELRQLRCLCRPHPAGESRREAESGQQRGQHRRCGENAGVGAGCEVVQG